MRKKKIFIITALGMVVILASVLLFSLYYSRRIKTPIEKDKWDAIKEYFKIELPENGELLTYDNALNMNDYSGILKAVFKLNNSDKNLLKQQLDEFDINTNFEVYEYNFNKEPDSINYVNSADEVDYYYQFKGKPKQSTEIYYQTYSPIIKVFIMKSEKGSFDVYFYLSYRDDTMLGL